MKHSHSAGGVVINDGKVLVVQQDGDKWSLPKGHVDPGETELQAAIREIREESGITKLELIKELGSYERYRMSLDGGDDINELKKITLFLFSTVQTKFAATDPRHTAGRWVTPDQVPRYLTHLKDRDFFRSIIPEIEAFLAK